MGGGGGDISTTKIMLSEIFMTSIMQYELVSLGFNEGEWHVVQEYINCIAPSEGVEYVVCSTRTQ